MTFFFAAVGAAQVFRLGEWEGAYESGLEYNQQDTKTGGAQASRLQSVLSENRLTLRNVGAHIYDPRLITFSAGGTFGLSQDWLTTDGARDSSQGTLLGYDLFASILPEKSLSMNLFANRNQSVLSGGLPGRNEVVTENRGATLFARRLPIPSILTFRQETQDQESQSAGTVARRSERRNVLTYEGERGWIDSEMWLRYEFVDLADEIVPNLGYQSHEGSLYYSLDFGSELNRRWDSRIRLFTRTGLTDLTTLTVDELLRIDHTERLQTNYRYFLMRVDTTGGATMSHTANFNLRHRLYESLTTNFDLDGIIQTLPGGERNQYRGRLDFVYTKRIPWDGRLHIGLGGGLQYEDSRFRGTETLIAQETHTAATPFALPIALNNPFVIEVVSVTKTSGVNCNGAAMPTLLVAGEDYTLNPVGDLTEIVPISCTAPAAIRGINPGDTIAVDYRIRVSPSLSFLTIPWHFNLSVDYGWIRPYFAHEQTSQSLLSGRGGQFLDDSSSDTLGTELRYDGQRLRARFTGEGRWFTSRRIAYDMVRSNQFLGYNISSDLTLTLSADQAWFSFSRPERETQTFGGRATLSYALNASLFADAFAGIRALTDSSLPRERITETGLRVRWMYRRVEVLPSIEFFDRRRGDTDTKDFRATLRMIRRF
jgi:hypothetical protein